MIIKVIRVMTIRVVVRVMIRVMIIKVTIRVMIIKVTIRVMIIKVTIKVMIIKVTIKAMVTRMPRKMVRVASSTQIRATMTIRVEAMPIRVMTTIMTPAFPINPMLIPSMTQPHPMIPHSPLFVYHTEFNTPYQPLRQLRHSRIPLISHSIEMYNALLLFLALCSVSLTQEVSKLHSFAPPFNNYAWSGNQLNKLCNSRKPQDQGMELRRQRQH